MNKIEERIEDYILGKLLKRKQRKLQEKNPYPQTVAEVIDDNLRFREDTLAVLKKFKKSKPWEGNQQEKFRQLNAELSAIYRIEEPQLVFVDKFATGSCYFPTGNVIILERESDGRFSVLVYLHEVGHALHKDEMATCRWSINLFKRVFTESFAKLEAKGHLLCRKDVKKDVVENPDLPNSSNNSSTAKPIG